MLYNIHIEYYDIYIIVLIVRHDIMKIRHDDYTSQWAGFQNDVTGNGVFKPDISLSSVFDARTLPMHYG